MHAQNAFFNNHLSKKEAGSVPVPLTTGQQYWCLRISIVIYPAASGFCVAMYYFDHRCVSTEVNNNSNKPEMGACVAHQKTDQTDNVELEIMEQDKPLHVFHLACFPLAFV